MHIPGRMNPVVFPDEWSIISYEMEIFLKSVSVPIASQGIEFLMRSTFHGKGPLERRLIGARDGFP